MSRSLSGKILVRATLVAKTPISVGGFGMGVEADMELAMDGQGRFYIPGTSLMGPIRHWMTQYLRDGDTLANELLGYQDKNDGHASYLCCENALVTLPAGLGVEIRDGIQILRATGTAREHFKYTRLVLPRGIEIPMALELDLPKNEVKAQTYTQALRTFLHEFMSQGLCLGAGKTRGLGRFIMKENSLNVFQYVFPGELDNWLDRVEVNSADTFMKDVCYATKPGNRFQIRVEWEPVSSVMVKAGREGNVANIMPLVSGYENNIVVPVIPGSALKGIFRSHAAKIVRTVWPEAPSSLPPKDEPSPDPELGIIADLFGKTACNGRVMIDDTYQHENKIDANKWVSEDPDTIGSASLHEDHVAIDRLTGGASDKALYSACTPKRDKGWEPFMLTVDFMRPGCIEKENVPHPLTPQECDAEMTLLLLVLRDLQAQLIPIGFGTRRGMGDIKVKQIRIKGFGKSEMTLDDLFVNEKELNRLNTAWQNAVTDKFKSFEQFSAIQCSTQQEVMA